MISPHAGTATVARSVWTATGDLPTFSPLQEDIAVDVCIVGGGIAGISLAYLLTKAGKLVAVLDDGPLGGGMSSMTTAHLTCVLDERYFDLERMHGEEGARLAAESHLTAINRIETIVASEQIDCSFERLNGYLFLSPDEDDDVLIRELAAAQRVGIDAALVDRAPKPSFESGRCLLFPNQAQFHPLRYIAGLARAIQRDGGRLFTMTHADKVEGGRPAHVTAGGHVVTADAVVVATLAPINDLVTVHTKQTGYMTYVLGARVPRGLVTRALYWDTGYPYHYARLQDAAAIGDGDDEILIIGGEDHRTGQTDDTTAHEMRLESWARERFPFITDIPYSWAGQVMQSIDGLAFIGHNPMDKDNVYVVTGDSGTGMTYATIAAILITDLIEGRKNPWQPLYEPSRKSLRAAPSYARAAARMVAQYAEWMTPGVRNADEVRPDSGAVVQEGLGKVAAYREPNGTLHRMSAVCQHLGCIVRWNATEKSWDCPCHGSRYDRFGAVITGPANSDLPPR